MRVPLLGLGVLAAGVLLCVASLVATDRALKTVDTPTAAAATGHTMAGMDMSAGSSTVKGQSFAGAAPENAADLAKAHTPYPAALPPLTPGDVVKVHMVLKDVTIEIAPGIKYAAWGFEGGAPGPVGSDEGTFRLPRAPRCACRRIPMLFPARRMRPHN